MNTSKVIKQNTSQYKSFSHMELNKCGDIYIQQIRSKDNLTNLFIKTLRNLIDCNVILEYDILRI